MLPDNFIEGLTLERSKLLEELQSIDSKRKSLRREIAKIDRGLKALSPQKPTLTADAIAPFIEAEAAASPHATAQELRDRVMRRLKADGYSSLTGWSRTFTKALNLLQARGTTPRAIPSP